MRGKVAKSLRKKAYVGEPKFIKKYDFVKHKKEKKLKDKDGVEQIYIIIVNTIVCVGPRARYLTAKKSYKNL